MNKYFKRLKFSEISSKSIVLGNIILFGIIFLTNSMIRFDNQIFTCSFWLLCDNKVNSPIHNLITFQLMISVMGFVVLLFLNQQRDFSKLGKQNRFFYFLIFLLSFSMIINSLFNLFSLQIRILLQIFLSLIIAVILTYFLVETDKQNQKRSGLVSAFHKNVTLLTISSFLMIILGVLTSFLDSSLICQQFPLCFMEDGFRLEIMIVNLHRIMTFLTGLLLIILFNQIWKKYRENLPLVISITMSLTIFIGQTLIGIIQIFKNFDQNLLFIHSTSSFLFALLIFYLFRNSVGVNDISERYPKTFFNDSKRRKDYLVLNKPIIVALLLVTTYAGMVVGGGEIPSFSLTIWTMIGGALAAGGASAINQYIDREIDSSMQRTEKRPLPSGRLYPSEALAVGIAEIIISFYVYTAFVNLNAALLAMLGMVYYVFLYSIWLKRLTVQNIVIGGGAGAIPPLVGWAAATGGLNIPSIFLFALVFLWTPPHFWALALVRKNDYARAKIPMMPVIEGEKKTRFQILIYTIQLVVLTLLMPLFGVGGGVYLLFAVLLGLWLLSTAWQVYKKEGNKIAFKMYRYSSMYLAFIFLALVVDVLI